MINLREISYLLEKYWNFPSFSLIEKKIQFSVHLHTDPSSEDHHLLLDLCPVLQLALAPPHPHQVQLHQGRGDRDSASHWSMISQMDASDWSIWVSLTPTFRVSEWFPSATSGWTVTLRCTSRCSSRTSRCSTWSPSSSPWSSTPASPSCCSSRLQELSMMELSGTKPDSR